MRKTIPGDVSGLPRVRWFGKTFKISEDELVSTALAPGDRIEEIFRIMKEEVDDGMNTEGYYRITDVRRSWQDSAETSVVYAYDVLGIEREK